MDAFALILALFMLLLGALAGAAATYFALRKNSRAVEEDFDAVSSRLSDVSAQFAAANAERRLLAAQNRELGESRSQDGSVLRALAPVAEKLTAVQQQVALLERDRLEQYGQLAQQLQEARLSDEQLIRSTHALESALRSNSARGQWGEVQLRRVVEAAGMLRHVDFVEQVHSTGSESSVRPDLVVQLPGEKQLVVDAKVPLSSYLEAQELGTHDSRGLSGYRFRHRPPLAANASRRRMPKRCGHTWTHWAIRSTGISLAIRPSW
jgi:DNA recombination protein RmuC